MAKSYAHLTQEERWYIKARLKTEDSLSQIARTLGWSPSTVSRELKPNSGQRGFGPKQSQGTMKQVTK